MEATGEAPVEPRWLARRADFAGWKGAALLLIFGLAAYWPAITGGGFIWDDHPHILDNKMLYAPDALRRIWLTLEFQQYYPVQLTSYWLELQCFGLSPLMMHLDNVLLHVLAAILLWQVLRKLALPFAWFAAALFLLHPANVETAAWLTERRNVLCAVFFFAALLCWLVFDETRRPKWYALSLGMCLLALLSKTIACSLPVVILIIAWARGKSLRGAGDPRRSLARDALYTAPMFMLGLPLGLLTAGMERYLIGADGYEWNFTFAQRLLICGRALWHYTFTILAPANLCFMYPRWNLDTGNVLQWGYVAAAGALLLLLIPLGRRFGRWTVAPLLCYGAMLFPALGFANIYPQRFSFVADHFQYLASAALIVFLAGALRRLPRLFPALRLPVWNAAGALLLAVLGTLSFRHAALYHSDAVMWDAVLKKDPSSWLAQANVATDAFNRGKFETAKLHYRRALNCGPRPPDTRVQFQYADALLALGDTAAARQAFERAVAVSPAFTMAATRNRPLPLWGRAIRTLAGTPPDFLTIYERHRATATEDALLALAALEKRESKPELALKWIEKAEELRPASYKPLMARGYLAAEAGQDEEALRLFSLAAAKTAVSGEPCVLRGRLLLRMGKIEAAQQSFSEALKREPRHAEAHLQLGVLLARAGNFPAALEHFRSAVESDPALADAHANLARVLLAVKNYAGAAAALRQALPKVRGADERQRLSDELAWLLATCPDDKVRNASAALQLAAPTGGRAISIQGLDAAAAAHADLGEFEQAIAFAEQARKAALATGNTRLDENIAARIELYKQKKPYRQP